MRFKALAAFLAFLIPAAQKPPVVEQAWIRSLIPGQETTAAYLTLKNPGTQPLVLTGASCDCAQTVEIHQILMAGDRMKMEPVSRLTIPPGGSVELKPGGYHLMVFGVHGELRPGGKVRLTLQFEKGEKLEVQIPVKAPEGARP